MSSASTDLVSVIVPICNVQKYLAECLESILAQTHRELEVICINDGSKDASLAIMQTFAARDSRVIVVDKPNEGYGATCNRGLEMAHGQALLSAVRRSDGRVLAEHEVAVEPDGRRQLLGHLQGRRRR